MTIVLKRRVWIREMREWSPWFEVGPDFDTVDAAKAFALTHRHLSHFKTQYRTAIKRQAAKIPPSHHRRYWKSKGSHGKQGSGQSQRPDRI
jgi:hypothetical protein